MLGLRNRYRGIVLEEPRVQDEHRRFTAICIEQNIAGSGATPEAAIGDLLETLQDAAAEEGLSASDPDPNLVAAYESEGAETSEGERIVERGQITILSAVKRQDGSGKKAGGKPREITFEPCA